MSMISLYQLYFFRSFYIANCIRINVFYNNNYILYIILIIRALPSRCVTYIFIVIFIIYIYHYQDDQDFH